MPIISETISGVFVQLPDDLRAPNTQKAIKHALKARKAREKAFAARDSADTSRFYIESEIARQNGALLDENPDAKIPDAQSIVDKAQRKVDTAQHDLNARIEAERRAAYKIREAAIDELPLLASTALADGTNALALLVAAAEAVTAAKEALYSSIGTASMCARLGDDPGAPLSIQHKAYGYTFDLDAAIEGLTSALLKADDEYVALRDALRAKKDPKTRKARKIVSEAPVEAPEASAPAETIAFEMGGDDD